MTLRNPFSDPKSDLEKRFNQEIVVVEHLMTQEIWTPVDLATGNNLGKEKDEEIAVQFAGKMAERAFELVSQLTPRELEEIVNEVVDE